MCLCLCVCVYVWVCVCGRACVRVQFIWILDYGEGRCPSIWILDYGEGRCPSIGHVGFWICCHSACNINVIKLFTQAK